MDNEIQETESVLAGNHMGASSSTPGMGGIDTFHPMMSLKKRYLSKTPKKLSDIVGNTRTLKSIIRKDMSGRQR